MIFNLENAKTVYEKNGVKGRIFYQKQNLEYLHLHFDIGAQTEPHVQNILMTFFIVKGNARLILNGEKHDLKAGQLVEIEEGMERQWINLGIETLEILVLKIGS